MKPSQSNSQNNSPENQTRPNPTPQQKSRTRQTKTKQAPKNHTQQTKAHHAQPPGPNGIKNMTHYRVLKQHTQPDIGQASRLNLALASNSTNLGDPPSDVNLANIVPDHIFRHSRQSEATTEGPDAKPGRSAAGCTLGRFAPWASNQNTMIRDTSTFRCRSSIFADRMGSPPRHPAVHQYPPSNLRATIDRSVYVSTFWCPESDPSDH